MITSFSVSNFKSIKELRLPMGRFMVLVGPNGAGKTNVVRALELFGDVLVRGTIDPVIEQGYEQVIRREKKPARSGLSFGVKLVLPRQVLEKSSRWIDTKEPNVEDRKVTFEGSLSIQGSARTGEAHIASEGLTLRSEKGELSLELVEDSLKVNPGEDPLLIRLLTGALGVNPWRKEPGHRLQLETARDILAQPDPERRALRLLNWQRLLSPWMRYVRDAAVVTRIRLDASSLRRDSAFEDSSRGRLIGPSGEGLAAAVYRIRGDGEKPHKEFAPVLEALQSVYPRIEDVRAERIPTGRLMLLFKERGIHEPLGQGNVSDGVLHALALLLALEGGMGGSGVLAIEEPENALHPWSLRSMMKRAQEHPRRQLLVTTHSETAVNAVQNIESLFVVENIDNLGTVVTPAVQKETALASIIEESGQKLGDVWVGGGIGGVPGGEP